MKIFLIRTLVVFVFAGLSGLRAKQDGEAELICMRKHNATNRCYYNFKIDGVKYHYIDPKCKEKREDVIKKVKQGKIALSKDWKLSCPGEDDDKKDQPN